MSTRREYEIEAINVNGVKISKVIIDSHYEEKHSETINDGLIISLVNKLDGRQETPEAVIEAYSYFATLIALGDRDYRLIWLLEVGAIYIGVVNTFRDTRKKGNE